MSMNTHAPRSTNWWMWGGVAVVIALIAGAGIYGYDRFIPKSDTANPALLTPAD